jgi:hypothetical protein
MQDKPSHQHPSSPHHSYPRPLSTITTGQSAYNPLNALHCCLLAGNHSYAGCHSMGSAALHTAISCPTNTTRLHHQPALMTLVIAHSNGAILIPDLQGLRLCSAGSPPAQIERITCRSQQVTAGQLLQPRHLWGCQTAPTPPPAAPLRCLTLLLPPLQPHQRQGSTPHPLRRGPKCPAAQRRVSAPAAAADCCCHHLSRCPAARSSGSAQPYQVQQALVLVLPAARRWT